MVGQFTGRLDDLFLTGLLSGLQIIYACTRSSWYSSVEYLHVEARGRLGYLLGGSQRLFLHEDRARLTHLAGRQHGSDLHGRSLCDVERSRIYGRFRGNVWSEYLYNTDIMEYRIYPRILALSEIAWSPLDRKDYKDFERRLDNAQVRLDGHDINYYIPQPEQPNGSCNPRFPGS